MWISNITANSFSLTNHFHCLLNTAANMAASLKEELKNE